MLYKHEAEEGCCAPNNSLAHWDAETQGAIAHLGWKELWEVEGHGCDLNGIPHEQIQLKTQNRWYEWCMKSYVEEKGRSYSQNNHSGFHHFFTTITAYGNGSEQYDPYTEEKDS